MSLRPYSIVVKAPVGTFNQEKALVGAFAVIVKTSRTYVSRTITTTEIRTGWEQGPESGSSQKHKLSFLGRTK